MNIFAVAWNLVDPDVNRVQAELRRMTAIYPSLDPSTAWVQRAKNGTFTASSISSSADSVQPRSYVFRQPEQTTFYVGLPVDPENVCAAHRAEDLGTRWNQVQDRLEGTYAVIRLSDNPAQLEIQTDILGGEPVYYSRHGNGWLISNSVLLLERLTDYRSLDELGVSMYLQLGHALGDRTLRDGIRVIPGAQRWLWSDSNSEPEKTDYYPLRNLGGRPYRKPTKSFILELAGNLEKPLTSFASHFDTMVCPLTGGKDSRVIAALLINAGIDTKYFTFGDPNGEDAQVARAIAARFDLQHQFQEIEEDDVVGDWDEKCIQNVRAADGMRSLYLLAGLSKSRPLNGARRDIYLWGACGEVGRSFFGNLPFLRPGLTIDDIKNFLKIAGPADPYGLVKIDALVRAKAWQDRYFEYCADQGIRLIDIPDIYGNHVVDSRRLGNNGRALAGTRDTFTPFASRAFLEAAFSIRSLQRYTEPLHFGLTRHLAPKLHRIPLAKSEWRTQNAIVNLVQMRAKRKARILKERLKERFRPIFQSGPTYRYRDSMFNRLDWFETKREHIRQLALDNESSSIWAFVERHKFEKIMAPDTHRAIRSQNLQLLFHIATLAYYESDTERRSVAGTETASKTGT